MNTIKDIFTTYYNPLCNYATKIVKDNYTAEDIVQSLFIQLWENDKLTSIEKPERFLLRSTKFKCIDFLRKQKKFSKVSLDDDNFSFQNSKTIDLDESDIEPLLHFFASKLPLKTREVFLLSRTSNLTYSQIAEEKGIAVKTVEAHMSKALKIMRVLLKEHDFYTLVLLLRALDF